MRKSSRNVEYAPDSLEYNHARNLLGYLIARGHYTPSKPRGCLARLKAKPRALEKLANDAGIVKEAILLFLGHCVRNRLSLNDFED